MKTLLREWLRPKVKPTPTQTDLTAMNGYTMSGLAVVEKLYRLGQDVAGRNIAGDFVECGVCDGGSAAALAYGLGDCDRRVWLYDSFEGLPPTTGLDGQFAETYVGACVGSEERVREALAIARIPNHRVVIRRGWFQDTFQQALPDSVALLHVDADWYESVLLSLDTFYDRVPDGGVILLDDFGHWEGCREAFYDFAQQRKIKPLLERFGHTQAFWVKGRTDNRAFSGQWQIP